MRSNPPRIRFNVAYVFAAMTVISNLITFTEQIQAARHRAKVALDARRKKREGFGFGRPSK